MDNAELLVVKHEVTTDNMKSLTYIVNGSIRGTRLPIEEQVIQWRNNLLDKEMEVGIGDYILAIRKKQTARNPYKTPVHYYSLTQDAYKRFLKELI